MGNESSKNARKKTSNKKDNQQQSPTSTFSTNRLQKALPSFKSGGPSSSFLHRHIEQARKSRTLQLKGIALKNLPPSIGELADVLRTIDLSVNKIRELPSHIGQFTMLRQLLIADNRLTHLPDEIGCLKTLEVLVASGNQLESVPESLVGCKSLCTVNLSNNKLSTLPTVLTHLFRLELLDLSGNAISTLPDEISNLSATELSLQRNQLVFLNSSWLIKCKRLKTLRVDENCLSKEEFTQELLTNSQLSLVTFEGNLFQEKDFQSLPGYEDYEQRFTATKRRLF